MSARVAAVIPPPYRPAIRGLFMPALVLGCAVIAGRAATSPHLLRPVFAACAVAIVVGLGVRLPRVLLFTLLLWLAALGLTRRLLSDVSPSGAMDPLLLVGPFALGILVFAAADRDAFRNRTTLSKLVLLLSVLIGLAAVNPLSGSLFAGVSALIFFVPVGAFWIGRGLCDDQALRRVLVGVALLGIPATLYGMVQTFSGFPAWDRNWIDAAGYTALNVNGAIRPFASFTSASEYATFLAVGIVVWVALGPRGVLRPVALAAGALLTAGAVYQSSRGTLVVLLVALALTLGARRRLPLWKSLAIGAALLLVLPTIVSRLAPQTYGSDPASQLLAHQVEGLANPLDSSSSTAGFHLDLIGHGVKSAIAEPLGQGIASITIAGSKFGGASFGTEADPSNAAVGLGLPGLLVYLAITFLAFRAAYRLAARSGDRLAAAAVGVLTATSLQWLNGGQYAVAFLPWLVLGWVDARTAAPAATHDDRDEQDEQDAANDNGRPPAAPTPRALHVVGMPRRWNLVDLERAVVSERRANTMFAYERQSLIVVLRPYAADDGTLPEEFDDLLEETFGAVAGRTSGGTT